MYFPFLVRKDLTKAVTTPVSAKRKSMAKEGSARGPRVDISNPAFLKPFDFGELIHHKFVRNILHYVSVIYIQQLAWT